MKINFKILCTAGALLCVGNVLALEPLDENNRVLQKLSISEKPSREEEEHLIQSHYDLETRSLNLSNQNLCLIPKGMRDLEDLEVLDLSNNELTCFSKVDLHKPLDIESCIPKNLKKLDIIGNKFSNLNVSALPSNLKELNLDGDLVKFIPKERVISVHWDTSIEVVKNLLLAYRNRYPIDNLSFLQILSPGIAAVILKKPEIKHKKMSGYWKQVPWSLKKPQ